MLGDTIEQALTSIGVTSERVTKWIGKPCRCQERREKLNALGSWASRVVSGKISKAKEYLERILS